VAYYAQVMKRVSETPEWADYIARTAQTSSYMAGPEFRAFIRADQERAHKIFEEEGWLVK